jgi:hypothetical protein
MARPEKNIVSYFPHQCEHGKTMFILENKYPIKGYYVWFKTLELLGKSNNHFIDCRSKANWQYLSAYMRVSEDELQEIYNSLADLEAIHPELWEHKIIWSLNFILGVKDVYRKRNKTCLSFNAICDELKIILRQKYDMRGIIDVVNPETDAGNG